MGIGKRGNQVNVIDFGHAKQYWDPETHCHIPFRENMEMIGTAHFASINAHLGTGMHYLLSTSCMYKLNSICRAISS